MPTCCCLAGASTAGPPSGPHPGGRGTTPAARLVSQDRQTESGDWGVIIGCERVRGLGTKGTKHVFSLMFTKISTRDSVCFLNRDCCDTNIRNLSSYSIASIISYIYYYL